MRHFVYFIVLLLGLVIVSLMISKCTSKPEETILTDTLFIYDTVKTPVVRDSTIIRYITRRLAVTRVDTVRQCDTLRAVDTVEVSLPFVQKVYKDTNYTAWISGYEPRLDSITIANKIVTRTNTVSKNKDKRFSLGVQTGFNVINKKPYFGVGITYNIINF